MKIYTKTGDKGSTSLFSGERIEKNHERVEAYGHIDELNSVLGALIANLPVGLDQLAAELQQIQRDLFQSASWIATMPESKSIEYLDEFDPARTGALESSIDRMQSELTELTVFILPGGCPAAAMAHMARTVCRRTERRLITVPINSGYAKPAEQLQRIRVFINRLSDYLFTAARFINHQAGQPDVKWKPRTST